MLAEDLVKSLKNQVQELKQLFVLGEQFLPHMDEVFMFFDEIKPVLDDIRHTVEENMVKIPKLAKELSHVTEANETATSEVMNVVDKVIEKAEAMSENIDKSLEYEKERNGKTAALIEAVLIAADGHEEFKDLMGELSDTQKYYAGKAGENHTDSLLPEMKTLADGISMDASSIFMALQVQDITAQQIAAVNNMLAEVQNKMKFILDKYHQTHLYADSFAGKSHDVEEMEMHREIVFDPHAITSIAHKDNRQDDIDKLFEQAGSVDDIEKAAENIEFSTEKEDENNDDEIIEDIPTDESASSSDSSGEAISQDDIDALFGNL
jgi:chemotaxis regulatin CheY-phosphate phosphatase CheZ